MNGYVDAIAYATPCACGNKKLAGPTSPAVVICSECGTSGVPAENMDWRRAIINWNTLGRIVAAAAAAGAGLLAAASK